MSRRSIVTARDAPVAKVVSAAGGLVIHGETLDVETRDRIELIDITDRVMAYVRKAGVREGMVSLWSMHTTCTVFINESQKALDADIRKFLEDTVARDKYYLHNDPEHSDCDRQNADAHLRAMLLGHSLTMQISGGELVLGRWQRVILGELDGPRARAVRAQVWGIS